MERWCSRISKQGMTLLGERSCAESILTKQMDGFSMPEEMS